MEGFPSQENKRLLSEEEVINTQKEEDVTLRHERHQKIISQLNESIAALQSKDGKGFTVDELRGYAKIYNDAVGANDLDSKYQDQDNVADMILIREKMKPFWELLDKALVTVAENALTKSDELTVKKVAYIYVLRGNHDEPLKYQEYAQDLKERIKADVEK
jgi:hypothetical protein